MRCVLAPSKPVPSSLSPVCRSALSLSRHPQVAKIIADLDVDNNGKIEWAEFASLMADRWLRKDGATDLKLATGLFVPERKPGAVEPLGDELLDTKRCARPPASSLTRREKDAPHARAPFPPLSLSRVCVCVCVCVCVSIPCTCICLLLPSC